MPKLFLNAARTLCACVLLGAAGCASVVPPLNPSLARFDPDYGYRFRNIAPGANSHSLFVVLSFSGGGTRSVALAYGVLEELRRQSIVWGGESRRLIDEVDLVSAVSGGSVTAAYWAAFGEELFTTFEQRFLKRDVNFEVGWRVFAPANLFFRLTSPYFGRGDVWAEFLDEEVFARRTFGDLLRANHRPMVVLNATDMSLGARFEFTQEQFDLLCSDLSSVSIGRAVAASNATPLVLSPMTFRNYAGSCDYTRPGWLTAALAQRERSARRYTRAKELTSYSNASARPYIHLVDGGIADNLGVRGALDTVTSFEDFSNLAREAGWSAIQKLVVIVVNAQAGPDLSLDRRAEIPGFGSILSAASSALINRYTFESAELMRHSMRGWTEEIQRQSASAAKAELYLIEVSAGKLRDEAERSFFDKIPSSFGLPPETVDWVRERGARVLRDSPDYQRLLRSLQ